MPSSPCTIGAGGAEGRRPAEGGVAGGTTTGARRWQLLQKSARPTKKARWPSLLSVPKRASDLTVLTTISEFVKFFVKTPSFYYPSLLAIF